MIPLVLPATHSRTICRKLWPAFVDKPLPLGKTLEVKQLVSSFSSYVNWPDGQVWQALALTKWFDSGVAMYVPASQQPYRPLVPVDEVKYDDHCPPHNVRLKPLLANTGRREFWKKSWKWIDKNKYKKMCQKTATTHKSIATSERSIIWWKTYCSQYWSRRSCSMPKCPNWRLNSIGTLHKQQHKQVEQ